MMWSERSSSLRALRLRERRIIASIGLVETRRDDS